MFVSCNGLINRLWSFRFRCLKCNFKIKNDYVDESVLKKTPQKAFKEMQKKIQTKWFYCFVFCLCSLTQVLPVPAAKRWRGFRSPALLLCHTHGAWLLHSAVWTGRLRPWGTGQWLHQRTALRTQPDQRARGEGHGTPQDLQVSQQLICVSKSIIWNNQNCFKIVRLHIYPVDHNMKLIGKIGFWIL